MTYHRLSSLFVAVLAAGSLALPASGQATFSTARSATSAKAGSALTHEAQCLDHLGRERVLRAALGEKGQ